LAIADLITVPLIYFWRNSGIDAFPSKGWQTYR